MTKKCFISAPAGTNLKSIESIVRDQGVELITSFKISDPGLMIADSILSAIQEADLFIAVVPANYPLTNIYFEIGIAYASRKPILVISDSPSSLPLEFSALFVIHASATDKEALRFSIPQFLSKSQPRPMPRKSLKRRSLPLGNRAVHYKSLLAKTHFEPSQIESTVAQFLKEAGADVVEQGGQQDRADIAIWLDDLEGITGNPLLIEVKRSLEAKSDARELIDRLESYLGRVSGKFALILYLRGLSSDELLDISWSPRIMFLKIPDLLDRLVYQSLSEIIREGRNLQAHSGSI